MSKIIIESSEIVSPRTQAQPTKTSSANPNRTSAVQVKLVAQWQLDENSKLYCRWVRVD